MKLLLIDTCDAVGTLALADTEHTPMVVATAALPSRSTAERLVPAIRSLLAEGGAPLATLAAIVVVHGPGSFTGVRVGVSAAKGLAEAAGVPLIALSRLAVLASGAARSIESSAATSAEHTIHAVLDAGRGEYYLGEYMVGIAERSAALSDGSASRKQLASCSLRCVGERLASREQIVASHRPTRGSGSPAPCFVCCEPAVAASLGAILCGPGTNESAVGVSGLDEQQTPFGSDNKSENKTENKSDNKKENSELEEGFLRLVPQPTAADALPLALASFAEKAFADGAILDANYLRRTDSELFAWAKIAAAQPAGLAAQVRVAVAADLDAILALERATDTAPHWPRASYEAILSAASADPTSPRRCLFVATFDGAVGGFAVGYLPPATDGAVLEAQFESVAVASWARRNGLGAALCKAVSAWSEGQGASAITLEVRAAGAAALALYTSLGFRMEGRRKGYYHHPVDDALLLRLSLPSTTKER